MTCRGAVVQCCTAAVITLSPDTGCSAPSCSLLSQGLETHWPGTREHRGVWWPLHWCGGQCTGHQWAREQLTPPLTDASAGCCTALHWRGGAGVVTLRGWAKVIRYAPMVVTVMRQVDTGLVTDNSSLSLSSLLAAGAAHAD